MARASTRMRLPLLLLFDEAHKSGRHTARQRTAVRVLQPDADRELGEKIAAAVHLMTGHRKHHRWTPTG